MKISFVLGHELPFPPNKGGGVNSLLLNLCNGMIELGHEVTVYSPTFEGKSNIEIKDGIKHIRVKGSNRKKNNINNFIAGIGYAFRVKKVLENCDVLSCHLLHGFLFSKTKKAKIVTHTIHRDPKRFLNLFYFVDRIYSGSDSIIYDAQKVVPKLSGKFKTIYNCVDFSNYQLPTKRVPDGCVKFLFVGRFSKDKGLESFIPAFCNAANKKDNIFFSTIGPMTAEGGGDELLVNEMSFYVKQQNLENRISFLNPIYDRNELDKLISEYDIIVLPSIGGETLNMSVLECMRLGKALLISDLIANKPLNKDAYTGYFVKRGDLYDWEDKIINIASDINLIEEFGVNSYNYCKEKFSCISVAENYVDDFEYLIKST